MKPTTVAAGLQILSGLFGWLWIGLWVATVVAAVRWWSGDISGWWPISFALGAMFSKAVTRSYMEETQQALAEMGAAAGALQMDELIPAYGAALEKAGATRSVVFDERRLPAPKLRIKGALLQALDQGDLTAELRQHIKNAYLSLAEFQPGVGDRLVSMPSAEDEDNVLELARRVSAVGDEVVRWQEIVEAEQGQLIEELRGAGHWESE